MPESENQVTDNPQLDNYIIVCNGKGLTLNRVEEVHRIVQENGGMTSALARMVRREFKFHIYTLPDYRFLGKFWWEFWR